MLRRTNLRYIAKKARAAAAEEQICFSWVLCLICVSHCVVWSVGVHTGESAQLFFNRESQNFQSTTLEVACGFDVAAAFAAELANEEEDRAKRAELLARQKREALREAAVKLHASKDNRLIDSVISSSTGLTALYTTCGAECNSEKAATAAVSVVA
jgi:hypothetical protein